VAWTCCWISTQRHRNTVLHTLTPLGAALIDANPLTTDRD
jgi:hypothetical protein